MSDKPKVYQGVRVRTTVKELLQRLRAREGGRSDPRTVAPPPKRTLPSRIHVNDPPCLPGEQMSQACSDLQDLCASTFPSLHAPPFAAAVTPADSQGGGSCSSQVLELTFNDVQQQFGEVMLPGNGYTGHNNNNNNYTGSSYSAFLPPPAAFPLPCCHARSSDADYYGMAPCSPPKLCSPPDPGSFSPQDSFSSSSSSSSCYDSPTRIEACYRGPPPPSEHLHYQHCSLPDCFCSPPRWVGQQESFSASEFPPYCPPGTGYEYTCPGAEGNYFRSAEMCYNVL